MGGGEKEREWRCTVVVVVIGGDCGGGGDGCIYVFVKLKSANH